MPHLDIEFDKIVGISSEGGTHVERDFKPWPGKFFDNPKDIRKKFHLVSWVLDGTRLPGSTSFEIGAGRSFCNEIHAPQCFTLRNGWRRCAGHMDMSRSC